MLNIERVYLAMAVNPATVQAISTALAGALSPLLQQSPTATATLTGHSSTGGTSPTNSGAGSSDRYVIIGYLL